MNTNIDYRVTTDIDKAASKFKNFSKEVNISNTAINQQGKLAQRTRLLNNELAFTIQDGAYAFNDLRMGVLGMSNNLPRLAYQIREMKGITGGWTGAIKSTIAGLFSFNGIMSIAVGALVAWTALSGRSKDETEGLGDEVKNLDDKLRGLTATLDNLATKQKEYNQSLKDSPELLANLSAQAMRLIDIQDKSPEQETFLNMILGSIEELRTGISPAIKENMELLNQFGKAASQGEKELALFIATTGLSKSQLEALSRQLKELDESVLAVAGGTAKGLSPELQLLADRLGLTRDQIKQAVKVYNEFFKSTNKVQKGVKWLNVEMATYNQHLIDIAKNNIELVESAEKAANALKSPTERFAQGATPVGMRDTNQFGRPDFSVTQQQLEELYWGLDMLSESAARTLEEEFSKAWQNIFGEANSLFEKLLSNIGENLLSRIAGYASGGIFNFFGGLLGLGGFGTEATATATADSGGGVQIVLNNQVGNQPIEKIVYDVFPTTFGRSVRERRIRV